MTFSDFKENQSQHSQHKRVVPRPFAQDSILVDSAAAAAAIQQQMYDGLRERTIGSTDSTLEKRNFSQKPREIKSRQSKITMNNQQEIAAANARQHNTIQRQVSIQIQHKGPRRARNESGTFMDSLGLRSKDDGSLDTEKNPITISNQRESVDGI